MPINILVGTDGRIKYTHFEALTTTEHLSELEDTIAHALE